MKDFRAREAIYLWVITILMISLTCLFLLSDYQYKEMIDVNDSMGRLIQKQREDNQDILELWEVSYKQLQTEYGNLLAENEKLKNDINGVTLPEYIYTESDLYLLARCVEAEAGDYETHMLSQKYITQVILNRLHSGEFPNSIEEVIYQKVNGVPQFSVAYNGMIDREVDLKTLVNVYEVILYGTDLPEYVCYFYADYVTDNWVNTIPIYDVVEGTVFAYEE